MATFTRLDDALNVLRKGPVTIKELCLRAGIIDPHNVIYILRYRGYDIRTIRIEGERECMYELHED
jgi:hypothetical protein